MKIANCKSQNLRIQLRGGLYPELFSKLLDLGFPPTIFHFSICLLHFALNPLALDIALPFHEQLVLLGGIALFAGRDHVAFGALAATDNRDDVIHGQRAGRDFFPAIVTQARGAASLPPLARTQLPGLLPLAPDLFLADGHDERGRLHSFTCTNT